MHYGSILFKSRWAYRNGDGNERQLFLEIESTDKMQYIDLVKKVLHHLSLEFDV